MSDRFWDFLDRVGGLPPVLSWFCFFVIIFCLVFVLSLFVHFPLIFMGLLSIPSSLGGATGSGLGTGFIGASMLCLR